MIIKAGGVGSISGRKGKFLYVKDETGYAHIIAKFTDEEAAEIFLKCVDEGMFRAMEKPRHE